MTSAGRDKMGRMGHAVRSNLPVSVPRGLRKRMTAHEVKLWNWLREELGPAGFHFRRQVPIGRFVVDFACLNQKLVVEVDGYQHGTTELRADRKRDGELAQLGYKISQVLEPRD